MKKMFFKEMSGFGVLFRNERPLFIIDLPLYNMTLDRTSSFGKFGAKIWSRFLCIGHIMSPETAAILTPNDLKVLFINVRRLENRL